MKVLIPLPTVLRIVFWLVTLAIVATLALGQQTSATPRPDSRAATQVVRIDQERR